MSDKRQRDPAEDPNDLVNAVIAHLGVPEETTNVAETYANDKNLASEVQAYAKIAGSTWTFYVKSLEVRIGRDTEMGKDMINIDLGPAKVVSRHHATIRYNHHSRGWELQVLGRNGAKVDMVRVPTGAGSIATPLGSGAVIDIGGTQMMFILPDAEPKVAPHVLEHMGPKLQWPVKKRMVVNGGVPVGVPVGVSHGSEIPHGIHSVPHPQSQQGAATVKAFQMYSQSPGQPSSGILDTNTDLSKEENKNIKPPYSYATMITQAILSNPEGVLSLAEIYEWISSHYAYYRFSKTGWQNSIRHNLSLNKAFEKVPRKPNEPGKGMKWQISANYKQDFMEKYMSGSLSKVRRGSSVSRQLQLHLAMHSDLPKGVQGVSQGTSPVPEGVSQGTSPVPQGIPQGAPHGLPSSVQGLAPPQRAIPQTIPHVPHASHVPNVPHSPSRSITTPALPLGTGLPHADMLQSPLKLSNAIEAYTPDRGSKVKDDLQSSPGVWNLLQFSSATNTPSHNKTSTRQSDERTTLATSMLNTNAASVSLVDDSPSKQSRL